VLEKPGFDACPPAMMAKGTRSVPMALRTTEISSTVPTSTMHVGIWFDDLNQCSADSGSVRGFTGYVVSKQDVHDMDVKVT
jgi:hypothetical protein